MKTRREHANYSENPGTSCCQVIVLPVLPDWGGLVQNYPRVNAVVMLKLVTHCYNLATVNAKMTNKPK